MVFHLLDLLIVYMFLHTSIIHTPIFCFLDTLLPERVIGITFLLKHSPNMTYKPHVEDMLWSPAYWVAK